MILQFYNLTILQFHLSLRLPILPTHRGGRGGFFLFIGLTPYAILCRAFSTFITC